MYQLFKRLYWWEKIIMLASLPLILLFIFIIANNVDAPSATNHQLEQDIPVSVSLSEREKVYYDPHLKKVSLTFDFDESLSQVFERANIPQSTLDAILNSDEDSKKQLESLTMGDKIDIYVDGQGQLQQLSYAILPEKILHIRRYGDEFTHEIENKSVFIEYDKPIISAVNGGFWRTAHALGLTEADKRSIADVLSKQIDIVNGLKPGAKFGVLFQQRYIDGVATGGKEIAVAVIDNIDRKYTAILNPKDNQYYDENGDALKDKFLRYPLANPRVTSDFSMNRRHPVTGLLVPHRGTDFSVTSGQAVGTPIWSVAEGIVIASGYNRFNGEYVFIQHGTDYITKYLHLNKRLVEKGQYVRVRTPIGTLGATGRVTGPHLHYEIVVNGVHQNPLTVTLPDYNFLSGVERANFKIFAEKQLNKFEMSKASKY